MYIAAHPDDENTRMLSWLAGIQHLETSYLSLTRGDGGQNLIGTEQSEALGLIRTQELLAARSIDGAKQYFTRALDFGFSKNPEETFSIWNKDSLLSDVVFLIRSRKPDIIITRFSPEPGPTHGHHTASAQLALLACEAAADSSMFPEQLKYVSVHKVNSLFWNTSWFFYGNKDYDKSGLIPVQIGVFNAQKGKWVGETAAESRSMHRSQGFGAERHRGEEVEYLKYLWGEKVERDPFENLDLTWNRVPGAKGMDKQIARFILQFDTKNPHKNIPALLQLRKKIEALPASFYRDLKWQEINDIIVDCSGFFAEATCSKVRFSPGENAEIKVSATAHPDVDLAFRLKNNDAAAFLSPKGTWTTDSFSRAMPRQISNPYWLNQNIQDALFVFDDKYSKLLHAGPLPWECEMELRINGTLFVKKIPIIHKVVKPELGEYYAYPIVMPPVQVAASSELIITGEDLAFWDLELNSNEDFETLEIVGLLNDKERIFSKLILNVEKGKKRIEKLAIPTHSIKGNMNHIRLRILHNSQPVAMESIRIEYPHIPTQYWQKELSVPIVKLDSVSLKKKIAYIHGAGDKVADVLELTGYNVQYLEASELSFERFKEFDVILCGIRAFNTHAALVKALPDLHKFVHQGGRLIVQYVTTASLLTKEIGPFPFQISRERVTDEKSEVHFLQEKHPILNGITHADFEDWIQERGLYFAGNPASEYVSLLGMNDPGAQQNNNSLIYAHYGKGDFMYCGLSFFRQLPAGNKGALRLLLALIENEKGNERK